VVIIGKLENIISEKLLRTLANHTTIYNLAVRVYRPIRTLKMKREFYRRIKQKNAPGYLDLSQKPNSNVIIIAIDCLRNSHLSCQGYSRQTTPFLDSLESRFTAISAASWTYPSTASILTGLYPHNHGAVLAGKIKDITKLGNLRALRDEVITLPEMLFLLGYKIFFGTAISLAYYPFRTRVIPREFAPFSRSDQVLGDLSRWINTQKGNPFFAYVHLGDLHIPFNPHVKFKNFFGEVKDLPNIKRWDFTTPEQRRTDVLRFQGYRENRELLYDNILRSVDHEIECFYKDLKKKGIADSSILVVTADHGEEFWEHAELEEHNFFHQRGIYGISHGHNVFNEIIKVPLLISGKVPRIKPDYLVSTVDIMPTLLDVLRVGHKMKFDGCNIFEAGGQRLLLNEASASGYEKKALITGKYKLIYSKDDGVEWLFDLEKDPKEQHPITDREVTSIFVKKLSRILAEGEMAKVIDSIKKKGL